jgi:hypothetical protein
MGEKTEADDFDEQDDDDIADEADDVDLARATKDLELARRRSGPKGAQPAWRKLEQLMEKKRTAELTSDFEDYQIDMPQRRRPSRPR